MGQAADERDWVARPRQQCAVVAAHGTGPHDGNAQQGGGRGIRRSGRGHEGFQAEKGWPAGATQCLRAAGCPPARPRN